jgi:hypothetical protein
MKHHGGGLSPPSRGRFGERIQEISDFWSALRVSDELGAANWTVLEPLERQVTEALSHNPPNLAKAESLTAEAMLLITGNYNL